MDQSTQPTVLVTPRGVPSRALASPALLWAGLLTLYFVWGSTYIGIRVSIETIPPLLMGAIRFFVAGSMLLAWEAVLAWRTQRDPGVPPDERPGRPTLREWRDSAIVGTALLLGGMGLVAIGEQTVPAGITAILVALMPVWVAVLGRVVFGERLPVAAGIGIVVGLLGVVFLVGPVGGAGGLAFDPFGLLVVLLSPLFWAAGSLFSAHRAVLPRRPLTATGLQMLCGAAALFLAGLAVGELNEFDLAAVSSRSAAALAYLIVIGSIVGFTTYVWLLRVAPLPMIATYAYVNPIVAFGLAAILLGEPIEPRTVLAGAVIVFAVALIVTARGRAAFVPGPEPEPEPTTERERRRPPELQRTAGGVRATYPD